MRAKMKFCGMRYEARSRGRSSPDTLASWARETPRSYSRLLLRLSRHFASLTEWASTFCLPVYASGATGSNRLLTMMFPRDTTYFRTFRKEMHEIRRLLLTSTDERQYQMGSTKRKYVDAQMRLNVVRNKSSSIKECNMVQNFKIETGSPLEKPFLKTIRDVNASLLGFVLNWNTNKKLRSVFFQNYDPYPVVYTTSHMLYNPTCCIMGCCISWHWEMLVYNIPQCQIIQHPTMPDYTTSHNARLYITQCIR